jgi:hypothetical protein
MSSEQPGKESHILQRVRAILSNVAGDTATAPGMRHPLSEKTAQGIHDCLTLIASREQELAGDGPDRGPELEARILRMVKRALTDVAKDTSAPPGTAHPLSLETIEGLRECFGLITTRERELAEQAGRPNRARPEFIDEPKATQVVTIHRKKPGSDSLH